MKHVLRFLGIWATLFFIGTFLALAPPLAAEWVFGVVYSGIVAAFIYFLIFI